MPILPDAPNAALRLGRIGPFANGIDITPPTPPIPPVPGPLDYIENGHDLTEIVVEYDLARDVAMLGVCFRHNGPITSVTATHGGEPLELVDFILNDNENIGVATFIGNGLTIEPANLVVTPVGGLIGPAVLRIDDSFAINEIEVGAHGARQGYSNKQDGAPPVDFAPISGTGYGVYALTTGSAEKQPFIAAWKGAPGASTLFWGVAAYGTLQDVPAVQSMAPDWTQEDDGWFEHTGNGSTVVQFEPFGPTYNNPYWWEVEVDVPADGRIYVRCVGNGGLYTSDMFQGPISGVFRGYRYQSNTFKSMSIQGWKEARFRNLKYCVDGNFVLGQFGRSMSTMPNNGQWSFAMGSLSRFAGAAMEVHEPTP
jgi:hypothetical protein